MVLFKACLLVLQAFLKLTPAAVLMMDTCLMLVHVVNRRSLITQHSSSVLPHASFLFALSFMPVFLASVRVSLSLSISVICISVGFFTGIKPP